jgi:IS4 transposase
MTNGKEVVFVFSGMKYHKIASGESSVKKYDRIRYLGGCVLYHMRRPLILLYICRGRVEVFLVGKLEEGVLSAWTMADDHQGIRRLYPHRVWKMSCRA